MPRCTDGPWRIGDAGRTVFGPPQGLPPKIIATNLSRADAKVIALAPEMLEILEEVTDHLAVTHWSLECVTRARAIIGRAYDG